MIEVGTHYCRHRAGEHVLVASSDVLLRTRCKLAAQEAESSRAHQRSQWVQFEHRLLFATLATISAAEASDIECLFLGPAPPTAKAAAAARAARRERAGIKQELTCDRREQAARLQARLEAAISCGHCAVRLPGAHEPPVAGLSEAARAAHSHAAALNDHAWVESSRATLRAGVERYWSRKSENAWGADAR